jgi:glutamyl-tRNA reductase
MHLLVCGMDHRTAPLEIRERCAWRPQELAAALAELRAGTELSEAVLLCTCNRTEVYAAAADPAAAVGRVAAVLGDRAGLPPAVLRDLLHTGIGAAETVRRLCRVACGLESLVVGETQVLDQIKDAYQRAAEAGSVGALLHGLFHQALFCTKRVHAETGLGTSPASVGGAAVEFARRTLGSLQGRRAVLLGAGETAETVARRLREAGFARLDVVNRTPSRAAGLAQEVGGSAWAADELSALLVGADVLITSTAAPGHLVVPEHVGARPPGHPLLVVDIAVPRDVDPRVGRLPGVRLCNIDDLHEVAESGRTGRAADVAAAEAIVADEVAKFQSWLGSRAAAPLLAALTGRMEAMARQQAERTLRRLPELDARGRALVEQMALAVVHKVLDAPLRRARDLGVAPGDDERLRLLSELFGLDLPTVVGLPGGERGA